jgi:hypothetical protein
VTDKIENQMTIFADREEKRDFIVNSVIATVIIFLGIAAS